MLEHLYSYSYSRSTQLARVCALFIDYVRDSSRARGTACATRNAYTIGLPAKDSKIEVQSANDGKAKPRNKKRSHCYAEKWIPDIKERLSQEGVSVLKVSLFALLKKFDSTGLVIDLKQKPTSRQLFLLFTAGFPEIQVSVSTVKRARRHLGWVSKKTRYCALIWEANKEKRLPWCQQRVEQNDLELNDVIFLMKVQFNLRATERRATTRQDSHLDFVGSPNTLRKCMFGVGFRLGVQPRWLFLQES